MITTDDRNRGGFGVISMRIVQTKLLQALPHLFLDRG
jgi:hypothetical protein